MNTPSSNRLAGEARALLDYTRELRLLSRLVRLQAKLADKRLRGMHATLRIAIALQAEIVQRLGREWANDRLTSRVIVDPPRRHARHSADRDAADWNRS